MLCTRQKRFHCPSTFVRPRRVKSARVPLRCLDALLGRFTPSIANIARPIRPWASQIACPGGEDGGDILAQRAHDVRDRREVRRGVAAERDERHVLAARALDSATAHDALRVREEHHLQEHRRLVRRGACLVIPVARVEMGEIDRVAEQVVERMLQRAGQQRRRQIHG